MRYLLFFTIAATLLAFISKSPKLDGSYIVRVEGNDRKAFEAHVKAVTNLFKNDKNNKIMNLYKNLGSMYHARFTKDIAEKVANLKGVKYVERETKAKKSAIQTNSPWNLARISQRNKLGPIRNYNYVEDGSGVTVYVIDSGVLVDHPEFEGRAQVGPSFCETSNNNNDEDGHGTHVAGIVASKTFGVSKKTNIVSVKVLDVNGDTVTSEIISAIDWAVGDKRGSKGNVINISITGEKSEALNDAAEIAFEKDFVVVTSAGNEGKDACLFSPGSAKNVITVASSDINDVKAVNSNRGYCVNIFAPGVDIISTSNNGQTETMSGTSMAAPHISGLTANLLDKKPDSAKNIFREIIDLASKKKITKAGLGSPNLLVFNGFE